MYDPMPSCAPPDPKTGTTIGNTVWYKFTPATTSMIKADTAGSNYRTVLVTYQASSDGLIEVGCSNGITKDGTVPASLVITAYSNTTYYFMIAAGPLETGGRLTFSVAYLDQR